MQLEMGVPGEPSTVRTRKSKLILVLEVISMSMAILSCVALVVMMLFVTIDVAGRDIFNWPLRGAFEIVGLLLIVGATWGLGLCQIEKKHLRIPLIYDLFPRKMRLWLDVLAYVCCLGASGVVAWQMAVLAIKYLRMPIGNTTTTLGLPFFPFMVALAWGFGWMSLILLVDIYNTIREVIKK